MVTATQRARFVLLCCILEVIVGIWSCFDVFVPRDMTIYVTYRCDFICKASRFFLCWMWTNMVGIWSRFDVFVTLYVTICHVHIYAYLHTYMCIRIHAHICMFIHICKANCVAIIAICTLFRAYGHSLTFSCPHIACPHI